MYRTDVTDEQRQYAWALVNQKDFGNRGTFDGTLERQYTGILGETVFADLFGLPRPNGERTGSDNGIDFVFGDKNIDLKTMAREDFAPVRAMNNLIASQVALSVTHVYVFASYAKKHKVMEFCGWTKKSAIGKGPIYLVRKGDPIKRFDGSTFECQIDTWQIPAGALEAFNSPESFASLLTLWAP